MINKELKDWTFDEVVQYSLGKIILAIPTGDFNHAVWAACDLAVQWRVTQESKQKKECK